MITPYIRRDVMERSGGRCEAMVLIPGKVIYTRCWKSPVEIHHLLTRARGGGILDEAGEIYHLVALCPSCHGKSDGAEAYDGGMLIDGYVTRVNGRPHYQGSDIVLRQRYGSQDQTKGA